MNISDLNPLGREVTGKSLQMGVPRKTESGGIIGAAGADTEPAEETRPEGSRDVYLSSEGRKQVSKLTALVGNEEEPPREDLVARARERAASGYYDSEEFLGRLAFRLIRTDLTV
jgi:hypothetical protein